MDIVNQNINLKSSVISQPVVLFLVLFHDCVILQENVTALEIAQAQGHEEACRVLHDHLKSQPSLQTAESDVSAGDTGKPPESQQSLQTEEVSAGDTDKPTESHTQQVLLRVLFVRLCFGLLDKATSSQTGTCTNLQLCVILHNDMLNLQVLKERIIRANNYFKTLFKRLEENLLPSKAEKARAIREFQSFPSPHPQPSTRVKKGKRQSGKRSRAKTDDVNVRIL